MSLSIEAQLRPRIAELENPAGSAGTPPEGWVRSVLLYFSLLQRWNTKINLSGFPLDAPSPEAIDRLLVEPWLGCVRVGVADAEGGVRRVLDIGSGGGSPAIPLALALRETGAGTAWLTMVESRRRKAVFLREALRTVELDGEVLDDRFDALNLPPASFQLICSRAVRLEEADCRKAVELLAPGGRLLLFHGVEGPGAAVDAHFSPIRSRTLVTEAGIATLYTPR